MIKIPDDIKEILNEPIIFAYHIPPYGEVKPTNKEYLAKTANLFWEYCPTYEKYKDFIENRIQKGVAMSLIKVIDRYYQQLKKRKK